MRYLFNKGNGLIENARVNGQIWIEQGPFLHLYVNLNHLSGAEVRKMADHYEVSAADWENAVLRAGVHPVQQGGVTADTDKM